MRYSVMLLACLALLGAPGCQIPTDGGSHEVYGGSSAGEDHVALTLRAVEDRLSHERAFTRTQIPQFDDWGTGLVPDSLYPRYRTGRILEGRLHLEGGSYRVEIKVEFARLNPFESQTYSLEFAGTYERWGVLLSLDSGEAHALGTESALMVSNFGGRWPLVADWLLFDPIVAENVPAEVSGAYVATELPPTKGVGWRAGIRRTVDSVKVQVTANEIQVRSWYSDRCSNCTTGGGSFHVTLPLVAGGPLIHVGDPVRYFGTLGSDGTLRAVLPLFKNPLGPDVNPWYRFWVSLTAVPEATRSN